MFKTLEEFIKDRRSKGGYSFTLTEVRKNFSISNNAAKQALYRYQKKGEITPVRNGFYVIITPEYSKRGMLPVFLYIDDMMKWLGKPYYLALFTAAALHGSAHQQPMESFIITVKPPLRNIFNKKNKINFIIKKSWDDADVVQKKTDAGYVNVSSPELTALDLMHYLRHGGINRCAQVVVGLAEVLEPGALEQAAIRFSKSTAIQRLGYLLENEFDREDLARPLYEVIKTRRFFYTPLSPYHAKKGDFISKWKIIKNIKVEIDL